jgi:peptidoglycan/xylan/chitin deacetylase (PgdA/CDA1 family)
VNPHLKSAIERGTLLTGIPSLSRFLSRRRALVLLYHNVVMDRTAPTGELSLHLPLRDFSAQLDVLARVADVVPLDELVEGRAGASRRIRVAITFDDAYLDALTVAIPELVRRRMPATIFVPPGLFNRRPWWDVVASRTQGEIPLARRTELLTKSAGDWQQILDDTGESLSGFGATSLPLIADESQVIEAANQPGITIGSHTWMHPNLVAVSAQGLGAELERSLEWLQDRVPTHLPFVTYPYGLASQQVEEAARAAGYRAGFLAGGGWLPSDLAPHRFHLPRYNVPAGLSLDGFRLRLSGLGLG